MKAIINNEVIEFPKKWSLKEITNFINQNFKICPYCGKIDIRLNHLNDCNYKIGQIKQDHEDNLWK